MCAPPNDQNPKTVGFLVVPKTAGMVAPARWGESENDKKDLITDKTWLRKSLEHMALMAKPVRDEYTSSSLRWPIR